MNKNILTSISILISGFLISASIIGFANAQTTTQTKLLQPQEQKMPGDIKYPIKELGSCQNKKECKVFCDDSKNSDACLSFAIKYNLMSPEELAVAKKFTDNGMVGPGNCKGQAGCNQYCENSAHLEECMSFAQENGMMTEQQLQDSQKVLTAVKNGLKPPSCSGPEQCNTYCSSSEHMQECMTFSLEAGLVPDNQKEQVQKTLDAIKRGIKLPACHSPQECNKYCSDPIHTEECMTFSLEAGLVPDNQKEQVQKTLNAIKQGIKPPACQPNQPNQSEQSDQPSQSIQSEQDLQPCDQYCTDPSHVEECVKFSVAVGNMTEQQAQISVKTGGRGPGECIGKEACDAFCSNPDNQEICFNFGKENGLIPQESLQKMQEGQQKMKDSFSKIPQEVLDCLTSLLGADVVEKMKTGSMIPQKDGDSINQCFQKYVPQDGAPNQNQSEQPGQNVSNNMMPGDVRDCIQTQVGEDGLAKIQSGNISDPVLMEKAKTCFDKYSQQNQQEQPNQPGPMQPGQINQQNQLEQPGQMQPSQFIQDQPGPMPSNQPGQMQLEQLNQINQLNPLNQPNQINQPGQVQINQSGQTQPQTQLQPQSQPQIIQQQNPPQIPEPSSFLQEAQRFLGSVIEAF